MKFRNTLSRLALMLVLAVSAISTSCHLAGSLHRNHYSYENIQRVPMKIPDNSYEYRGYFFEYGTGPLYRDGVYVGPGQGGLNR